MIKSKLKKYKAKALHTVDRYVYILNPPKVEDVAHCDFNLNNIIYYKNYGSNGNWIFPDSRKSFNIPFNKKEGMIEWTFNTKSMEGISHPDYIYFFMIRDNLYPSAIENNFFLCFYNVHQRKLKVWLSVDQEVNSVIIDTPMLCCEEQRTVRLTWNENDYFRIYFDNAKVNEVPIGTFNVQPERVCIGENMEPTYPSRRSRFLCNELIILSKDIGNSPIPKNMLIEFSKNYSSHKI
ncbi:hypothetical protein [Cytobacillus sp. IB215665]|uniref:hypothetical protein n=1 Tax=Cytobacillus sp. IB215665 TaxID=3097357 RepID=UPI002A0CE120|nr:hypothetical protein [Cytobacillus sp. IB215665]MDX8365986.1 hypothetical protein [Cytobacillus sp. IB215665]